MKGNQVYKEHTFFNVLNLKVGHTHMNVQQAVRYVMVEFGKDLGCNYSFICIEISILNVGTGENHPVHIWHDRDCHQDYYYY